MPSPRPPVLALRLLAVAGLCVAISACSEKPKEAPVEEKAPMTAAPLAFARPGPDAEVTLTLPEPIKAYPELHTRLYTEGAADLEAFSEQAKSDRAELLAAGSEPPPFFRSIAWKLPAQSDRLVSAYAEISDYTGGAHPNSNFQTVIWDKARKEAVDARKLFVAGADFSSVDTYLCRQIEAERSRRAETPTTQADSGFTCPKLIESRLALVASKQAGKIGAVEALFAPYDVGPYAEGPYMIRVPQTLLKGLIDPAYAADFAGEPVLPAPAS